MTEPVYLDPATEEVRSLLARSLEQTTDAPERLAIRCKACGRKVARVVATSHGPGFWSSWETEEPLDYKVIVNGQELNRRDALAFRDAHESVTERSGPPIDHTGRDGVMALLALPTEMEQDYPALLVRCPAHGDTVLDRTEVLTRLRSGAPWTVALSKPFTEYRYHNPTGAGLPAVTRTQREVRHFGRRKSAGSTGDED